MYEVVNIQMWVKMCIFSKLISLWWKYVKLLPTFECIVQLSTAILLSKEYYDTFNQSSPFLVSCFM